VLEVLAEHRAPDTPVALVDDATRPGERVARMTLAEVDPERVSMRTLVLVAGEGARNVGQWLVAERDRARAAR
jgi:precorrin-3B methylase